MIKTSLNDSKPPDLEILPSMMCDVDSTTNNNKNVVQIVTIRLRMYFNVYTCSLPCLA